MRSQLASTVAIVIDRDKSIATSTGPYATFKYMQFSPLTYINILIAEYGIKMSNKSNIKSMLLK